MGVTSGWAPGPSGYKRWILYNPEPLSDAVEQSIEDPPQFVEPLTLGFVSYLPWPNVF